MQTILTVIVLCLLLLASMFFIQRFMIQRAIRQVVDIFRRHGAMQAGSAKTLQELGLGAKSFLTKMTSSRDYKPDVMKVLIQKEVILLTEEGKLYLAEGKLNDFFKKKM